MNRRECVFCGIMAGRSSAVILAKYYDLDAWIIAPLNPVVAGHVLAIPFCLSVDPWPHPDNALSHERTTAATMRAAVRYASQMPGYESCNFITSVGRPATQSVSHLHVHVVPRVDGDGLALPWTSGSRKVR